MEKHLQGAPLILRAVDLVIAQVEKQDDSSDREEALKLLHELRQNVLSEG